MSRAVDRQEYWNNYYKNHGDNAYKNHDEEMKQFHETLTFLNFYAKYKDAECALRAYLAFRTKNAEPWMYDALAVAIEINKGNRDDIKKALGYAADMAERTHNPNHILIAADQMFLLGDDYARVGRMLDEVGALVPHQANPLIMSVNLALKTKDPKRMAAAVDALLALGWPEQDERIRRDARRTVEKLAATLREDNRAAEADELLASLTKSEARDLFIRLTWTGNAGLDLVVDEPLGATARYFTPRTTFGGALVKNGHGAHPEDVYVCPRAFDGDYTVRIETFYNDDAKPATAATLEIITHEGTPREHKEIRTIKLGETPAAPIVVHLTSGRRTTVLPFVSPRAGAAAAAATPPPKPNVRRSAASP